MGVRMKSFAIIFVPGAVISDEKFEGPYRKRLSKHIFSPGKPRILQQAIFAPSPSALSLSSLPSTHGTPPTVLLFRLWLYVRLTTLASQLS